MDGNFYPYGNAGDSTQLGSGAGEGYNLNFPLNPIAQDDQVGD